MWKRNGVSLLLVVVVGAGMEVRGWGEGKGKLPFTVSKETTGIVGPLRADGTVDYLGAVNEKYGKGVTAENNGFVVWLKVVGTGTDGMPAKTKAEILKMCGAEEMGAGEKTLVSFEQYLREQRGLTGNASHPALDEVTEADRTLWSADEHEALARYLTANEKQLAIVAEAAERPRWWIPYSGESLTGMMVSAREAACALVARATLRAKSGDFDGFLADVMTVKRLGRHVGAGATLYEWSAGAAIDRAANQAIGAAAGAGIFSEAQCQPIGRALQDLVPMPEVAEHIDFCERWTLLSSVVHFSGSRGDRFGGDEASLLSIEKVSVDWDVVLKLVNRTMDRVVAGLREADFAHSHGALAAVENDVKKWSEDQLAKNDGLLWQEKGETQAAYSERVGKAVLRVWLASYVKVDERAHRGNLEREMVRTLLAAAEFRAKKGKWPGKLEELGQLKGIPRDMYSKEGREGVKYGATGKGVRVWSVGPNGVDDGGEKDDISVGMAGGG